MYTFPTHEPCLSDEEHQLLEKILDDEELGRDVAEPRLIGLGGTAIILRAEERATGRTIALRVPKPAPLLKEKHRAELAERGEIIERITRHLGGARPQEMAGTPTYYGTIRAGEMLIGKEQFIDGCTLDAFIESNGPIPVRETLRLMKTIAHTIDGLHKGCGLGHGDLWGGNIMVDRELHAYVIDFGLSSPLQQRNGGISSSGERHVVAPEDYDALERTGAYHLSTKSDVYALGVLTYQLLTGRLPFDATGLENGAARQAIQAQKRHLAFRNLRVTTSEDPHSAGPNGWREDWKSTLNSFRAQLRGFRSIAEGDLETAEEREAHRAAFERQSYLEDVLIRSFSHHTTRYATPLEFLAALEASQARLRSHTERVAPFAYASMITLMATGIGFIAGSPPVREFLDELRAPTTIISETVRRYQLSPEARRAEDRERLSESLNMYEDGRTGPLIDLWERANACYERGDTTGARDALEQAWAGYQEYLPELHFGHRIPYLLARDRHAAGYADIGELIQLTLDADRFLDERLEAYEAPTEAYHRERLAPEHALIKEQLADLYVESRQYTAALSAASDALNLDESPERFRLRASIYSALGEESLALQDATAARALETGR